MRLQMTRDTAMLVLAIFLILWGLFSLLPALSVPGASLILGVLAVIAGVLILIRR